MMRKSVKVGVRVAPLYNDTPHGTISEILNEIYVMVEWDGNPPWESGDTSPTREQIKFLRKIKQ